MPKKRKVTASSVSALLGKTHERASSYKSRIKGIRNWSRGFQVSADWQQPNAVRVRFRSSYANTDQQARNVRKYAETLEPHYTVTSYETHLIITEKK